VEQVDLDYYHARLRAEERAAASAKHPLAADCHRRLAKEYADLLFAVGAMPRVSARG
jgi:hypothetical protein